MASHYEILGLSLLATDQEIKIAYRRLARTYHPDLNKSPNAAEKFREVQTAYEVLSDSHARKVYDTLERLKRLTDTPDTPPHRRRTFRMTIGTLPPQRITRWKSYLKQEDVVYTLRDAALFYGNSEEVERVLNILADAFEDLH